MPNDKVSRIKNKAPEPQTQQVEGYVIPEQMFDQMKDWIKKYVPTGETEMLWPAIRKVRPQTMTMSLDQMPPEGDAE